ncbi:MAG: hypothetical protein M3N54_13855 [Acidobacteriota bacterium]|nr:hypothetical protein [Acidobacteriota bacterium]
MYFSGLRRAGAVALLLFSAGVFTSCQKRVTESPPRYAVLRFENLSGDPALEWAGRGTSEFLSRSLSAALAGPVLNYAALGRLSPALGSRPGNAPGISTERSEALLAGATRLITGYVERSGGSIRIAAEEIDVRSSKSVRRLTASGSTVLGALTQLSGEFSPAAQPYLTSSAEALRYYVNGFEESGDQAIGDLQRSLDADPDFGPAWSLLVNANLARGNRDAAEVLIGKAGHRRLDLFNQANLEYSGAVLRSDQGDQLLAMRRISALSPGDTVLLRSTAEADTRAGEFTYAAAEWNKLAAVLPDDAGAWNQLGYTRAWGGDYAGALAALKEYARLRPGDPNPLDSAGDVHYLFRKYADAAASYLEANARSPEFQSGGSLYKAAWAKFNAGDKTGADSAFIQFKAAREKAKATGIWLFEADWLYRTGRTKQALALLERESSPDARLQLAIWYLIAGDRTAAAKEAAAAGPPTTGAAFLVRFATLPSASAAEWQRRAERMFPASATATVRMIAVGYALLLDQNEDDALPVWRKIIAEEPGTDFFSHAIYARLNGEKETLAILPDPNTVNEFAAVLDNLPTEAEPPAKALPPA